jgi:endonuclease III related protein
VRNNIYEEAYRLLYAHFGPQGWWPGETPFEVMVGAVLTQNTSWSNVMKAIANLKNDGLLSFETLSRCSADEIAPYIRSSGYYNLKARRLRNLLDLIDNCYDGKLDDFLKDKLEPARGNLLEVKGIGPETADSILLYACGHPIFVIDMYTHRVFSRHNLVMEESDYHSMQQAFMDNLPHDSRLFNEFHALIVRVATTCCKKNNPLCDLCPLQGLNL